MDNQHKKISGYRDLSQADIDMMNAVKALERLVGEQMALAAALPEVDKRCLALARTELQTGFMWFVRAIAKPEELICAP